MVWFLAKNLSLSKLRDIRNDLTLQRKTMPTQKEASLRAMPRITTLAFTQVMLTHGPRVLPLCGHPESKPTSPLCTRPIHSYHIPHICSPLSPNTAPARGNCLWTGREFVQGGGTLQGRARQAPSVPVVEPDGLDSNPTTCSLPNSGEKNKRFNLFCTLVVF